MCSNILEFIVMGSNLKFQLITIVSRYPQNRIMVNSKKEKLIDALMACGLSSAATLVSVVTLFPKFTRAPSEIEGIALCVLFVSAPMALVNGYELVRISLYE